MSTPEPSRPRRTVSWTPVLFLSLFLGLVAVIAVYWMLPMMRAVHEGTPADRQRATLYGTLVMILLLALLLIGLLASFRFSAWLFRSGEPRKPTNYVDIWEEAGRRTLPPTPEELEDPDEK